MILSQQDLKVGGFGLVKIRGEVGWLDQDKGGLLYPCPKFAKLVG